MEAGKRGIAPPFTSDTGASEAQKSQRKRQISNAMLHDGRQTPDDSLKTPSKRERRKGIKESTRKQQNQPATDPSEGERERARPQREGLRAGPRQTPRDADRARQLFYPHAMERG